MCLGLQYLPLYSPSPRVKALLQLKITVFVGVTLFFFSLLCIFRMVVLVSLGQPAQIQVPLLNHMLAGLQPMPHNMTSACLCAFILGTFITRGKTDASYPD